LLLRLLSGKIETLRNKLMKRKFLTLNDRALFLFTNVYAIMDVKNSKSNHRAREQQDQQPETAQVDAAENA